MGRANFAALILSAVFLIQTLASPGMAMPAQYCAGMNTLVTANATDINGDWTNTTVYSWCPNGCNNQTYECNPPQYSETNVAFLFIAIIAGALFLFIGSSVKEEDWPISLIFLFASLFFIFSSMGMASTFIMNTAATAFAPYHVLYWVSLIIFAVILIYYALKTIIKVMVDMGKIKVKK